MLGGVKWIVGNAILERFSTVSEDLGTRFSHWSDSIDLVPGDAGGILTGIGRGVFPRAYLKNSPTRGEHLTTPGFREDSKLRPRDNPVNRVNTGVGCRNDSCLFGDVTASLR